MSIPLPPNCWGLGVLSRAITQWITPQQFSQFLLLQPVFAESAPLQGKPERRLEDGMPHENGYKRCTLRRCKEFCYSIT